jgi:hypothetical protein
MGLTSSLVSMFFTVFANGSKGGIFCTSEKILTPDGTISNPFGDFSEDFTLPETAMDEWALRDDSVSRISSGQSPFYLCHPLRSLIH